MGVTEAAYRQGGNDVYQLVAAGFGLDEPQIAPPQQTVLGASKLSLRLSTGGRSKGSACGLETSQGPYFLRLNRYMLWPAAPGITMPLCPLRQNRRILSHALSLALHGADIVLISLRAIQIL